MHVTFVPSVQRTSPYNGQNLWSQCVRYSEVLLYMPLNKILAKSNNNNDSSKRLTCSIHKGGTELSKVVRQPLCISNCWWRRFNIGIYTVGRSNHSVYTCARTSARPAFCPAPNTAESAPALRTVPESCTAFAVPAGPPLIQR